MLDEKKRHLCFGRAIRLNEDGPKPKVQAKTKQEALGFDSQRTNKVIKSSTQDLLGNKEEEVGKQTSRSGV